MEVIRIEDKPEGSIFWEWTERPSLLILPRRMTVEEGLEVTLTAGPSEAANCYAAALLSRWAAEQARSQLQPGQPQVTYRRTNALAAAWLFPPRGE